MNSMNVRHQVLFKDNDDFDNCFCLKKASVEINDGYHLEKMPKSEIVDVKTTLSSLPFGLLNIADLCAEYGADGFKGCPRFCLHLKCIVKEVKYCLSKQVTLSGFDNFWK